MRKFVLLVASIAVAVPAFAATETLKDVSVVDAKCSAKVASNPDSHPRACALQCADGGFVVITADKKILKLDEAGNAKVKEALKASDKKDHLRANVTGEVEGDSIKVTSFQLL